MINPATIQPGLEIPTISRPGDFQLWNRFAGVNYEFSGHHMDDEAARHEGFAAAFGMGPFIQGLVHTLLRAWLGEDDATVLKIALQTRSPWLRGRTMTLGGVVTAVRREGDMLIATLDVWGDDDTGAKLLTGEAEAALCCAGVAG